MGRQEKPEQTPEEARKDHLAAAAIIWLDIAGIGTRISHASNPILPALLLIVPFATVFGGVVTASAIITMPYEKKFRD
jgi:hypothetical protein